MTVPVSDALDEAAQAAAGKSAKLRTPLRYLVLSAFAGAYIGIAVVLLVAVSGPLADAGSAATTLVQGAVFGIALTLIVFAGAELFTGNAMYMIQGLYARTARVRDLTGVWVASLVGNLVGSVGFAAVVHASGALAGGGANTSPGQALIASLVDGKAAATGPQLFWRSVLCNLLVCLALWMAMRTDNDIAKLGVLWWGLLAFIASGFEHSVANMTIFSLGIFDGTATWAELSRNLAWTVPGNIVGGGLLVGLAYAWLGGSRPGRQSSPDVPPDHLAEEALDPAPVEAAAATDGQVAEPVAASALHGKPPPER